MQRQQVYNMRTDLKFYRRLLEALPPDSPVYKEVWTRAEKLRARIGDVLELPTVYKPEVVDEALDALEQWIEKHTKTKEDKE